MTALRRLTPPLWMRLILQCGIAGAVWLLAANALALDRERSLAQLHHTSWTARDGAPSQVYALAQTSDGYLWIGGSTGLFRFDGVTFERYETIGGTQLPSIQVSALLATREGGLWIGFRSGAVALLRDKTLQVYSSKDELPPDKVLGFAQDHDGAIWVGTASGLAVRKGNRWKTVGAAQGFPEGERASLLGVDRTGTLWAAGIEKLLFLPRGEHVFRDTGQRLNDGVQIAQDATGRHWIAETTRAVRPLALASDGRVGKNEEIWVGASAITFDDDGGLWITTVGDGLRRISHPEKSSPASRAEAFTQADGLSSDYMIAVLEDREGNLWFGSDKGIDRFRHGDVVPVNLPAAHTGFTLMAGIGGDILAASASNKPLLQIRGSTLIPHAQVEIIDGVYRDPVGTIWWYGYTGLWRHYQGGFALMPWPPGVRLGDWILLTLHGDGNGGLWANILGHGFKHFRDGKWEDTSPSHYPAGTTSAVFEDAQGRVWLGTLPDRLHRIEGGKTHTYTAEDGPHVGRVMAIGGRGPHLWVSGELGLGLYHNGRFSKISTVGNDPLGSISGLVETTSGDLWLNAVQGAIRIPAAEVAQVLADPAHPVRYRRFDYLDGLPGAPQMTPTNFTVAEASDGRVWFATDNGLAWIDPHRFHHNPVPPPVRVRAVDVDGHPFSLDPLLQLPVGAQQLRIAYTALSLSIPERVQFRYQLEGVDQGWQDAGTRREAAYTNLRPGHYRFRVLAANEDGVWNEQGATLEIQIPPPFYLTTWFQTLCVLVVAGLLWLIYLRRLRVMEERLQARLAERHLERERIARELHDTLLQGIQGLILRFQSAIEKLPVQEPARVAMEGALERADDVLSEGRDRVQGLRTATVPVSDLPQSLASTAAELMDDCAPDFQLHVEGNPTPLDPLARDEIFSIAREALVNAFNHARASKVTVELDYGARALRLRVSDDGCGIAPDVLAVGVRPGHWGLSGMRERAARISAELTLRQRAVAGTEVELCVPARVVYRPALAGWRRWFGRAPNKGARSARE
ncbi:sensor histidine kinase [Xanthomonas arboricola]|uniref:sensor histidine kinase n=2 Tax=Xanthomonas TaxID=338 RepID=UPI000E1E2DA5|nr:two-component regulator propeller domain-containing protein [Xanthomonas arboricola]